jgi:hypothetical protein
MANKARRTLEDVLDVCMYVSLCTRTRSAAQVAAAGGAVRQGGRWSRARGGGASCLVQHRPIRFFIIQRWMER